MAKVVPHDPKSPIIVGNLGLVIRESNHKMLFQLPDSDGSNVARHELALSGAKLEYMCADMAAGDKILVPTATQYAGLMAMVRDDEFLPKKKKR